MMVWPTPAPRSSLNSEKSSGISQELSHGLGHFSTLYYHHHYHHHCYHSLSVIHIDRDILNLYTVTNRIRDFQLI